MSVKFTRRVAAEILGRGETAIWIKPDSVEEVKKAITRDDIRKLIKDGIIVAVKTKSELHPKSALAKRKKGQGKRRGSLKARQGRIWEKKVRSQRVLLKRLKLMAKIDNPTFKKYYLLVKGNAFPDKRSLLLHLSDDGIKISEEELKKISDFAKSAYK